MRVRFVGHDGGPPLEIRRRVEQRLRLVVGRRAPSVAHVDISLASEGVGPSTSRDPRAATGRCCRIRARLVTGVQLVVEEWGADVDAAVDVAAWRLDRRLDRAGVGGSRGGSSGR